MTSQGNLSILNKSSYLPNSRASSLQVERIIYELKIILVGDVAVGKTALINRFTENIFSDKYVSNIGVEFKVKQIYLNDTPGVELKIWDTCGEEKFRAMTRQYYRDSNGIILMLDLTDKKTFDSLGRWYKDLRDNGPKGSIIFLVGNKSDLIENRVVSTEECQTFAQKHGMKYIEVSAKTGDNIELVFDKLAYECVEKLTNTAEEDEFEVKSRKEKSMSKIDLGKGHKEISGLQKIRENEKLAQDKVGCC